MDNVTYNFDKLSKNIISILFVGICFIFTALHVFRDILQK